MHFLILFYILYAFYLQAHLKVKGIIKCFKSHGNGADFFNFYINWFRIVSLHNHSRLSDFGVEFAEILITKNQLPALVSRGVADTAYQWYREYRWFRELLTPCMGDTVSRCWLPASVIGGVDNYPNRCCGDCRLPQCPISVIQEVGDSPYLWY
jgi:hypothetical protein